MKKKIVNVLCGFLVVFVIFIFAYDLVSSICLAYNKINLISNKIVDTKVDKEIQKISESEKAKQYCDLEIIADFTTRADGYIGNNTIYYDKNTGVMYYRMSNAMFPILNSDGTPKLYEGELK